MHLCIAGPAEALVALGAVGGHLQEVGALGAVDVGQQRVGHRVARLQVPDALQGAAQLDGAHACQRRRARVPAAQLVMSAGCIDLVLSPQVFVMVTLEIKGSPCCTSE